MTEPVWIIGGGVAGLGCAKTLHAAKVPFKLITKELGGRIVESSNQSVNYGAYYITADYHNIKPLVTLGRRISLLNFQFHHPGQAYSMLSVRSIHYLPQLLRLRRLLHTFRQHVRQLRQAATTEEQSVLLEHDPYLWKLLHQSATSFVQDQQLTRLFRDYISQALYATDFVSLSELQAFDLLWLAQPMITPTYEYSFDPSVVTKPFQAAVLLDEVITLTATNQGYHLTTKQHGVQRANYVVVAVPTPVMQQLLHTTEGKGPVNAYMYHLHGQLRTTYTTRRYNVFADDQQLITIAAESDGSYLVYGRTRLASLTKWFTNYEIITERAWQPAFNIIGTGLTKQKRGDNLYVAGEHNICTLEDSYLTGVYAANQLIRKLKHNL